MSAPHTLIIAEAGVNHNGDIALAHRLIDVAQESGADIVKFQTFSADRLVKKDAPKAEYQDTNVGKAVSQHALLKGLELSPEAHIELLRHCQELGIEFLSTPFDIESLEELRSHGMLRRVKVASGEMTNFPLLRAAAQTGLPVIISTGMAKMEECRAALDVLNRFGAKGLVTMLHCNTEYPTPLKDVNLRAMLTIGRELGIPVGYSDHTLGTEVPVAAVALGAMMIEKHFTLDRTMEGPDHRASLEPGELKSMVSQIRHIEQALGNGDKTPSPSEIKNAPIARKSIVAARFIARGEKFTDENLRAKRPGTGISPMLWEKVIGTTATRDFAPDEMIEIPQ
ncbi:MAG: N-acetylneuraminate synthase [Bdellovibrionales bacterium RIFOXYC1_FULL_54_43]|nr:MAG: N-acetylneuraminate synthase [Bdellovibrionales bacterium RIFOXYC1_FULL_54_43]OFZ83945.1 MAG: N-acetylneuraminate synthase [Bdellovibrionales bacterium RIFOXYD1_FULL_55_31]